MGEFDQSEGLQRAIAVAGSTRALARLLGVSPQAILKWRDVPAHWIIEMEKVTKVPREQLRPELYRK